MLLLVVCRVLCVGLVLLVDMCCLWFAVCWLVVLLVVAGGLLCVVRCVLCVACNVLFNAVCCLLCVACSA